MPFIKDIGVRKSKTVATSSVVVCQIGAGSLFSNALNSNGKAWGWGDNVYGQVGDNTTTTRCSPVSVAGAAKTFCQISAGQQSSFALVIDKNGKVWAWGTNAVGQLGDNTVVSKRTPVSIQGAAKTFCQISAGTAHSLAIDKNGKAWAWGSNGSGRLGANSLLTNINTPVSVAGAAKTFCQIGGGTAFSLAIDKNGLVWAWGFNGNGQLGDNSMVSKNTPVSILGATKTFCKIAAGNTTSHAIDKNGKGWSWGGNASGQLGNGGGLSRLTPVSIGGAAKTFCDIDAGASHSIAVDKNGQVWLWGSEFFGQLGQGSLTDGTARLTPVSLRGTKRTFCKVTAGNCHSLAIDKNGKVWAWGALNIAQLGIGIITRTSTTTPMSIVGARTFCKIAAGVSCTILAIDYQGKVWGWGLNQHGSIGDNTIFSKQSPVSIAGAAKTFCKIAIVGYLGGGGSNHSLGIDKNGRAWAWGLNNTGQLGNNSITSRLTPVSILGAVKTFCEISAGNCFSVAIDKDGKTWAWGSNNVGQLGDNTIVSKRTPVSIQGAAKTFCQISAGRSHTVALDYLGVLWAWGLNTSGQLGDRTITNKCTPVSVDNSVGTVFIEIHTGNDHNLALDNSNGVWAWGSNITGQLGDNSITNRCTPVQIYSNTVAQFYRVSAGQGFSAGIDGAGQVWAWGLNNVGQLGDNTIVSKRTPVSIAGVKKTFCEIQATGCNTIAIDYQGKVWTWGSNDSGQLADNTLYRTTPVQVCTI